MATCRFPMGKVLLASPPFAIVPFGPFIPGGRCSQGGVKIPTGGKGEVAQARERLLPHRKGQQIRCDSEADGESPDERERSRQPHSARRVVPCALILVLKEESHESDVARRSPSTRRSRSRCSGSKRLSRSRNGRSSTGSSAPALCKAAAGRLRAVRLASRGGPGMPARLPRGDRGAPYCARADRFVRGARLVRDPPARPTAGQDPALH